MSMPYGRRRGRSYTRKIKGKPPRILLYRAAKPHTPNLMSRIFSAAFSLFTRPFK